MSRLNIATNAGQIAGTGAAGFILEWSTYFAGFAMLTACAVGALVLNQLFKFEEAAAKAPPAPILATYRMLFRMRKIRYGILCAYISALPVSLSFSFYPILFVEEGLGADIAGTLVSVRGLGAMTAGFVAGYLVRLFPGHALLNFLAAIVGVSVILSAATGQAVPTGACLFALGLSTGVITTYFQTMVGEISTRETRGSAMALAGIGWSISHMTTPFIMGVLQEATSTKAAFYAMGALTLLCSAALWRLRHWAFAPDYVETQER
jgi:MFS family permease